MFTAIVVRCAPRRAAKDEAYALPIIPVDDDRNVFEHSPLPLIDCPDGGLYRLMGSQLWVRREHAFLRAKKLGDLVVWAHADLRARHHVPWAHTIYLPRVIFDALT